MAAVIPFERHLLARTFARRRAVRARVIAVIATLLTAWCAHVAMAAPVMQSAAEQQSLGSVQQSAQSATSSGVSEAVRMLGALTVVVGLAFAAKWWLRRSGIATRMQGGAFEIVARHSVGRGQNILLVRFGPRLLCVEQARDGLRTLSELTDPAQVAATMAEARGGDANRGASSASAASQFRGAALDTDSASAARTVDLRRGKETGL
jgi:flagellar biogenesis protein FliO